MFGSSFDRCDAALDLTGPDRLGVRIGRLLDAPEQFGRQFGARLEIESQGLSETGPRGS